MSSLTLAGLTRDQGQPSPQYAKIGPRNRMSRFFENRRVTTVAGA